MSVTITEYQWGGRKFCYTIKSHCPDCDIVKAIIENMLTKEFKGKKVHFEVKPWFDNFFYCLFRKTWHAPIVMINGKKFWQYHEYDPLFDRQALKDEVLKKLL